ncbi:MAG: hypothetical protein LBF37_02570, partial [Rickettsiales bacterium]|nr:hypothetical protein [Rickettsiales bacterium]
LAVVPAAFAATARPSVLGTASARLPTLTASINSAATASASTATTLATNECVDAYTSCLKSAEICGQNFEECTNKTLFFSKKSLCASTLMQCNTAGITSLFGSATQTAFANKNATGDYIYPTDGSVLGQMIEAAHISNRYDTSSCVRRYTTCLKKDDVCGADFELCTSNTEFKKQKLFCESTLARCQNDGLTELFGTTSMAANPTAGSRIGIMISEGASLAAVNAVATCYKVADQCILNACALNPYKCKEGSNRILVSSVDTINEDGTTTTTNNYGTDAVNRNEISGFIRNACADTIGGNKFCYATFLGNGAMPTNSQLQDEDNRGDIYAEAYSSRMNDSMRSKIDDLIEKFEKKTKQRCQDAIVSCGMRSCGEGSGAACYASAFNAANTIKGVTNPSTLTDIKYGCEAVVNNDTACKYSAATFQITTGMLSFLDTNLFDVLFTSPDDTRITKPDPVGAVAALNAKLSLSYNQAALDTMKRQCQTVATGCVKTMCGADYTNCYRNRTDVYSNLTNTDSDSFNKSMNKVGGVLDYTVVLGLCLNTVKTNPVCEEHIKSEAARARAGRDVTSVWGGATSARDGWLGASTYSATETTSTYQDMDADDNLLCTTAANGSGQIARCDDVSGLYIHPYMISESAYNIARAESTIFRDLVFDLEKEAQAIYNSKLTKQQNLCLQGNNGGIIGTKDLGGTFQWVKLRNNKVPASYSTKGLETKQFVASNELYGSFCRIRVTLQSDDKKIQDAISAGKDWGTAYFAAGDTFTCGSWIPEKELTNISQAVGDEAKSEAKRGDSRTRTWMTLLGTVVGGAGGAIATNALQKGSLGGLLGTTNKTDENTTTKNQCVNYVNSYKQMANGKSAAGYGNAAIEAAKKLGDLSDSDARLTVARDAINAASNQSLIYEDEFGTAEEIRAKADAITQARNKKNVANISMDTLKIFCETEVDSAKGSKKTTVNLIGTGVGAIAGGVLAYQATKSVQDASAENAEAKAKAEWMEDVGNHIRCYIGADEVGMYSDIISTEME